MVKTDASLESVNYDVRLEPVNSDFKTALVVELADKIWREAYSKILEKEQIDYMLSTMQSFDAIKKSIETDNYKYYIMIYNDIPVGYSAVQFKNKKCFLSKLYILSEYRHKKIAAYVVKFFERKGLLDGMSHMWLTCNKHNERAINAYKKMGFETVATQEVDIGQGYIMDDCIMEKALVLK